MAQASKKASKASKSKSSKMANSSHQQHPMKKTNGPSSCTRLLFFCLLSTFSLLVLVVTNDYKQGDMRESYTKHVPPQVREGLETLQKTSSEVMAPLYAHFLHGYEMGFNFSRDNLNDLSIGGIHVNEIVFGDWGDQEEESEGVKKQKEAVEEMKAKVEAMSAKAKQQKMAQEAEAKEDEKKAKKEAEEKAKEEAIKKEKQEAENKAKEDAEKAKEEAERKAKEEDEKKAKEEAEMKAKLEAQRRAKEEAEKKAKVEAERKAKEEAEKKAKLEAEKKAKEEAEKKAKEEAEKKAKLEAERKAKEEAEKKAKLEAERKAKEEAEKKAKEEAEKKAKLEAERKAKEEAEKKAKLEAERKAKEEAERKAKEEAEKKTRLEAERKAKEEAEKKAKEEAEKKAKEEAERKAKEEAEKETRLEAERKAKEEAEKKEKEEAEKKAKEEAEKKAKEEAERKAKQEAEKKTRLEAERKAKEEAEKKAKEEAERKAKEEAEKKTRLEAERKAKEEAEKKAKEEAERKAKEEADKKAKLEAERKAKLESEKKAKEEAEKKVKLEAERKAKEEADRKAKLEAERRAKVEAERKAKEEGEIKAKLDAAREAKLAAERQSKEEAENKGKKAEESAREEAVKRTKDDLEKKVPKDADEKSTKNEEDERMEAAKKAGKFAQDMDKKNKPDVYQTLVLASSQVSLDPHNSISLIDSLLGDKRFEAHAMLEALCVKSTALYNLGQKLRSNRYLDRSIRVCENALLNYMDTWSSINRSVIVKCSLDCSERLQFRGLSSKAARILDFVNKNTRTDEESEDKLALQRALGLQYLISGQNAAAATTFEALLKVHPTDNFAKAHLGFILKTSEEDLERGVQLLQEALKSNESSIEDARFYLQLADGLRRLNRQNESDRVFNIGVEKGFFLSFYQRSLYNCPGLTARPVWTKDQTGIREELEVLEANWKMIRDEALALVEDESFMAESEKLRDQGSWNQLDLYIQGRKLPNCKKAPGTCSLIDKIPSASTNKRGQVKFSVMSSGTHVHPHSGPTNCRLRVHLGLRIPERSSDETGLKMRVAEEFLTWQEGQVFIFDDSFDHEVWHFDQGDRLVLIVDIWHPDLDEKQRSTLTPL